MFFLAFSIVSRIAGWLLFLSTVASQFTGTQLDLVVDGFVDTEACYAAIVFADVDIIGELDASEYVDFVKALGPVGFLDGINTFETLPLQLTTNFNTLACLCKRGNGNQDCCIGEKAHIETGGAFPGENPTPPQQSYLFLVCSLTTAAIERVLQSSPPTAVPTSEPTSTPSSKPSPFPTAYPTLLPSAKPSSSPTQPGTVSQLPSASPTLRPSAAPSPSPSLTPSGAPVPAPDILTTTVTTDYSIAISNGVADEVASSVYIPELVASMDMLANEVFSEYENAQGSNEQNRLRMLRIARKLFDSIQTPTSIADISLTDCPAGTSNGDRCEDVIASIEVVQDGGGGNNEDPTDFMALLQKAVDEGRLQLALDTVAPNSLVTILTGDGGGGGIETAGLSVGATAAIVVSALAAICLVGTYLIFGRSEEGKEPYNDLEPAPSRDADQDDAAHHILDDDYRDPPSTLGAAVPDYGNRHPTYEKDLEESLDDHRYDVGHIEHDSSSNAGSSGWSSSAGVSSLNTGSADGLDDPVIGMTSGGATLATIGAASAISRGKMGSDSGENVPSIPLVTRADLDNAIAASDWAAVGATAALLAAASDSQSQSSRSVPMSGGFSHGSSVSSLDAARAAELDHLVDAGDWEGVVMAAAKYEAAEGSSNYREGSEASQSDNRSGSITGSGTYPSGSTTSISESPSKAQKRQEIRAEVEALVRRVVPEEIDNVDEMMLQFRGREEELVETLRTMQERAVAQKARAGAQKAAKQEAKRKASANRGAPGQLPPTGRTPPIDSANTQWPNSFGATNESSNIARSSSDGERSGGSGSFPQVTSKGSHSPSSAGFTTNGTEQGSGSKRAPSGVENRNVALEDAIEAEDWNAVGAAAGLLSDASTADTDEINRLAEGASASGSSRTSSRIDVTHAQAAQLDELIDKGDWTGVVAAASRYEAEKHQAPTGSSGSKREHPERKEHTIEDERRQRRLKRLQEEQDALEQAEIWMAIAEQSKQEAERQDTGASDAADWAIARSLTLLNQAEQQGQLKDSDSSRSPSQKDTDSEKEV